MKKFALWLGMLLLFPLAALAQTTTSDRFTITPAGELVPGGAATYFDVSLEGSRLYTAYNMDITLPEGLSFAKNASGNYRLSMRKPSLYPYTEVEEENEEGEIVTTKSYSHSMDFALQANGNMRLYCISFKNEDFTAESGALFRVYVQASPYAKPGTHEVKLTGLNLTVAENAKKYVPEGDLNVGTLTVASNSSVSIKISAANQFGTCILPFALSVLPEGLKAYTAGEVDGNVLPLNPVEQLEAFKPYVLYAENGYEGTFSGMVDASAYPEASSVTVGALTGVLAQQEVTAGYILQNQGEGTQFYAVGNAPFILPAGRCFLSVPAAASSLRFFFNDSTSGISEVECSAAQPSVLYDLQGRRVKQAQPGGIYLSKDKKLMLKKK